MIHECVMVYFEVPVYDTFSDEVFRIRQIYVVFVLHLFIAAFVIL